MNFKKLVRLLAPILLEGVLSVRRHSQERLVEMLHELEFVTRSVTQAADGVSVELQILDEDLFFRLLAGEANKFLLASRVSHARATQDQVNNASWQTVEHYYAAYYGVHYLLRLTGVSITNIDERSIDVITRGALGAPMQAQVPSGLYLMQYNENTQILTLRKRTKKGAGGSHQDAWKLWEELVEKLRNQTGMDPIEYAGVAVDLAAHKSFLTKSTAKYNPPDIRGEINYQFKGGSWVFESKAKESIERIQRSIASPQIVHPTRTPSPEGLVASNKMIIGLARAVFQHASERYPKSICRSLANKYSSYIA